MQSSGIFTTFGAHGSAEPTILGNKVIGVAQMKTPGGQAGYWEANSNGMVYAYGAAQNYGNVANSS